MIKNKIITLMTFLILFIFPSFVFAFSENFQFTGAKDINVYECATSKGSVISVINIGDVSSSYTISISGSAAKFVSLGPLYFELEPGQSQDITTYFIVPCGKKGKYDLEIHVTTALNLKKILKQNIIVEKPENIELIPIGYSKKINPCGTASYQFNLKNTGDFEETYSLKFEKPFGLYTNVNFNQITLGPDEEALLYIYITPLCNIYGNYNIPFSIRTLNTKLYAKTFVYLIIEKAYDYSLKLGELGITDFVEHDEGEIYSLCTNSKEIIPIKLKNNADLLNTYNINIKAPNWIKLSDNYVEVDKFEEKIIQLNINTSNIEGDFNAVIDVISELGDIQKTENITLSIENCYEPYISTLDNTKKFVLDYSPVNVPLNIENKGTKTAKYDIFLDAEDWLSIEKPSLSVGPGKTETINIISTPTNTTPRGTYKADMQIKVSGTNVVYEDSLKITLVTMNLFDRIYYNYMAPYLLYLLSAILVLVILVIILKKYKKKIKRLIKKIKIKRRIKKLRIIKKKKIYVILILLLVVLLALFVLLKIKENIFLSVKDFLVGYWVYFLIGFGVLLVIIIVLLIIKKLKRKIKPEKLLKATKKVKKLKKPKLKFNKKIFKVLLVILILAVLGYFVGEDFYSDIGKNITENITELEEIGNLTAESPIVPSVFNNLWSFFVRNVNHILYVIVSLVILLFLFLVLKTIKKRNRTYSHVDSADRDIVLRNKKISCGEIIIKLKRRVYNTELLLKKVRKPTFIKAEDFVYEYIELTQNNLDNSDIDEIIIRFRVKKSWLKKNNIKKGEISLRRYHHQWGGVNTRLISEDKKYYYYESVLKHLGYFAVVGKRTEPIKIEKKPKKLLVLKKRIRFDKNKFKKPFWFFIVLLIIAVVLILGYYFWENILNFIILYKWYILGIVILLLLVVLDALFIKWLKKRSKERIKGRISFKTKKFLLSVLLLVVIVAIIVLGFVYLKSVFTKDKDINETIVQEKIIENKTFVSVEEEIGIVKEEQKGIPDQEWDEDTNQIINLSNYFLDPDRDKLYYTNTELQNIKVVYEDGNAILIPNRNWYGSEFVIFTANDMKGGKVDSNLVKLTVRDVPETNIFVRLWDYISK